jgi:hypothetical protein
MRITDLDQLVHFHNHLNPDIWTGEEMKLEVRVHLFKIARAFIQFIDVDDLKLTDITISGSNASFNYNANSDIDLHLIADIDGPCELNLQDLFLAKKSQFNDQHDINIYGHDVEVYVQDSDQPHISNGVYSLYHGEWIKKPEHITAEPDTTNIEHKYQHMKAEIEQAISSGNPQTIQRLKKRIKSFRQAGLEKSGEFGVENLTFKLLRNTGDMDKLWQAEVKAADDQLSLGEGNQFTHALAQARESGDKEFTVDGKTYKVKKSRKKR